VYCQLRVLTRAPYCSILDKVRSDPQVTLTPEMFMAIVHEAARTAGLGSDLQQAMGYRAVYFGPS
jgi:hypothetical protein